MKAIKNFLKIYSDKTYKYSTVVTHKGKTIAFAMDDKQVIYYSVLDLDNRDEDKSSLDVNYWLNNPRVLQFSNEIATVGYGIVDPKQIPLIKKGTEDEADSGTLRPEEIDPFLSTTARFTADVPFQIMSDDKFLYLFRQSINKTHPYAEIEERKPGGGLLSIFGTFGEKIIDELTGRNIYVDNNLLVDRFVLAGTQLQRKMEVRYQRSRNKDRPASHKDSLGAKDLDNNPFYEPTHKLDFVANLQQGQFTVLLLPTQLAGIQCWQIFTHNSKTDLMDTFNIERSTDGLFNTKGIQLYTSPDPQYQRSVLERQPGIDPFTKKPLIPLLSKSQYAGSSLQFNGQGNYTQIPNHANLDLTNNFALEAWIKAEKENGDILNKWHHQGVKGGFAFRITRGYLNFTNFGINFSSKDQLTLGVWHHVAVVFKSKENPGDEAEENEIAQLFIDGKLQGEKTPNQPGRISKFPLVMGSASTAATLLAKYTQRLEAEEKRLLAEKKKDSPDQEEEKLKAAVKEEAKKNVKTSPAWFQGQIDEVRIWNRTRTRTEIITSMNHRLEGREPGLVGYWRFDEGSGEDLHNRTGDYLDGKIHGAIWVSSDAPIGEHPGIRRSSFAISSGLGDAALGFSGKGLAECRVREPWGGVGKEFTIEMWVKVDTAKQKAFTSIFNNSNSPGAQHRFTHNGMTFQIQIVEQGYLVVYDGLNKKTAPGDNHQFFICEISPKVWQHVCVTYDGEVFNSYLNGQWQNRKSIKLGLKFHYYALGSNRHRGSRFYGQLDEVRIWDKARTEQEISADMSRSLIGNEANLMGYWRCNEGFGNKLEDSTPYGNTLILDKVSWLKSDSPVAQNSQLSNTRTIVSAPSALLYYQQEKTAAGYDRRQKPLARNARVMMAVATKGDLDEDDYKIAILDFSVSREGRLAQVPAIVDLPPIVKPSLTQKDSDEITVLTAEIEDLDEKIKKLEDGIQESVKKIEEIEKKIKQGGTASWDYYRQLESIQFPGYYLTSDNNDRGVVLDKEYKGNYEKYRQYWLLADSTIQNGRTRANLSIGSSVVNINEVGSFSLGLGGTSGSLQEKDTWEKVPTGDDRYQFNIRFLKQFRSEDSEQQSVYLVAKDNSTCDLSVDSSEGEKGEWKLHITDRHKLHQDIENIQRDNKEENEEIRRLKTNRKNKQLALDGLKSQSLENLALPMSLLHFDVFGLTVSGGLLHFASTHEIPRLMKSATGKLALYFRQKPDDAFCVAYYDTNTTKASFSLEADEGSLIALVRSAESEFDAIRITIEDSDQPEFCTVTIENDGSAARNQEIWERVPREVEQFAATLNGARTKPTFIGKLTHPAVGDNVTRLSIDELKDNLLSKTRLLVNGSKVIVEGERSKKATEITIESTHLSAEINTPVLMIPYDYDDWAKSGKAGIKLNFGSSQVRIESGDAKGDVKNREDKDNTNETTLPCQWVAESLGKTLFFGGDDYVQSDSPSDLSLLDSLGDLTLEAWVEPTTVKFADKTACLIHHYSDNSKYTLQLYSDSLSGQQEPGIYFLAGIGNLVKKSKIPFQHDRWTHLAAVYNQSYGLEFGGNGVLKCESNETLNLDRDLTIEVYLQVKGHGQNRGILTKGKVGDGTDENVPYSLWLDEDNRIFFTYENKNGSLQEIGAYRKLTEEEKEEELNYYLVHPGDKHGFLQKIGAYHRLTEGEFYTIAVTRRFTTETSNQGTEEIPDLVVKQQVEISFFINGKAPNPQSYDSSDLGRNSQPLEIGKIYHEMQENYFQGVISEIRLWNKALEPENLHLKLNGNEKGLISWWRFEEGEGSVAYDSKGNNHAKITTAKWVNNPDPQGSSMILYKNGDPVPIVDVSANPWGKEQFTLGAILDTQDNPNKLFIGRMEEVRIWKIARTQEQIQDNLFGRIKGEKQDLLAYYTFDEESEAELLDRGLRGNDLTLGSGDRKPEWVPSDAPISQDTAIVRSALASVATQFHETIDNSPAVTEYADLQYDVEGNLLGVQKRCYTYIKNNQWYLITGYKVGNLLTEWVGQVQSNPQIIGYIEGAPPVPSENLTGTSMALGPGVDHYEASAIELVEADSVNYIYASSKESAFDMSIDMKAGLGFSQETEAGFVVATQVTDIMSVIGTHSIFESSQGMLSEASVTYGYNKSKVSRLDFRGAWEQPGEEINPFVGRRYIPFNIGLALVQSDTMDVFALRLEHNDALVSYRMMPNPDIPKDWNIITFPINPTYTKQGTLDGKVGFQSEDGTVQPDPDYPNAATYGSWSYFKPMEAYRLKKQIEQERAQLQTYYQQYSTFQNVAYQAGGALNDLPSRQVATRNLVNTYVWTADGGFFAESSEVMEATSEATTGFYSFQGMAGASTDIQVAIGGVATKFELDALFGGHLETTKVKGQETEKSFAIEVEVEGERDIQFYAMTDDLKEKYKGRMNESGGVYDEQGNPIKQPGKVDAYRFMTFYLEPNTNNFEDFFGKVVDPIWLEQSNAPNAIALRHANQGEKKPKCWRVFHRVTFVSRILQQIQTQNTPPVEKAIRAANIESNWELLKTLEPFVRHKIGNYPNFAEAVRETIATYLPELKDKNPDENKKIEQEIIKLAALYFGVEDRI